MSDSLLELFFLLKIVLIFFSFTVIFFKILNFFGKEK